MRNIILSLMCAGLGGLSSRADAAEHRVGGSLSTDFSSGLITGIDRIGLHAGAGYTLLGARQGLFVDARLQQFVWDANWERFPAVNLGWTMRWREDGWSPYHSVGAMALVTGTMDTALSPVVPALTLEGGADLRGEEAMWVRVGLQGFATFPALAAGAGPRLSVGLSF